MFALQLHIAGEQSRFRVYPSFRLQGHDLLGDLLCVIRFVRTDFGCAESQKHLGLPRRISRVLQIFLVGSLSAGEILKLGLRITEIEPEIRLYRSQVVALAKRRQILFRDGVVFLVVKFEPKPFQDFGRRSGLRVRGHEGIYFFR